MVKETLSFYAATYLERDVRELVKAKYVSRFSLFLLSAVFPDAQQLYVVYGGTSDQIRGGVRFVPWRNIDSLFV